MARGAKYKALTVYIVSYAYAYVYTVMYAISEQRSAQQSKMYAVRRFLWNSVISASYVPGNIKCVLLYALSTVCSEIEEFLRKSTKNDVRRTNGLTKPNNERLSCTSPCTCTRTRIIT